VKPLSETVISQSPTVSFGDFTKSLYSYAYAILVALYDIRPLKGFGPIYKTLNLLTYLLTYYC